MQQPSVERNILGRVNVFILSDIPKITKRLYVRMYVLYHSLRNNFKVMLTMTTMTKCCYFYLNLKLRGQVFLLLSFFFDVLKLIIDYHRTEQHPKCLLKPL